MLCRPADRLGAHPGDEDRRVGSLQRSWRQRDLVDLEEPALVGVDRLCPQAPHHLVHLAQTRPAVLGGDTKGFDLGRAPGPQAEVQAAVTQHVERCRLLGHMERMPDRRHDNRSAEADARGAGGEMGHHKERSPRQAIPGEVVLGCPGGMEAQLLSELHLLDQVGEGPRVGTALGPGHVVEQGVFHGNLSRIGGGDPAAGDMGAFAYDSTIWEAVAAQTTLEARCRRACVSHPIAGSVTSLS